MLQARDVATVGGNNLALSWGVSGFRMVIINDWHLVMKFAASQLLPDSSTNRKDGQDIDVDHDRIAAVRPMPLDVVDISHCVASDEATVIAADADDFDSPYTHLKSAQSPAHHSSREWLDLARNPAVHKRRKIKLHDLAADVPPGWTREVESDCPFANHLTYYLSILRLIRDVAGIPFDARCIMVSSKKIDPIEGENAAIIEVEAEFSVGGRHLLLWDDKNPDWQLFKFRSPATSDNLVDYLSNGTVMGTLATQSCCVWIRRP